MNLIDKFLKLQESIHDSLDNPFKIAKQTIVEVSKERLEKYKQKAGESFDKARDDYDDADETQKNLKSTPAEKEAAAEKKKNAENTIGKRNSGIWRAKEKLGEEEISEVSKERLANYINASADDSGNSRYLAGGTSNNSRRTDFNNISKKRISGIKTATKKLSGSAKVNAKEEVEFSDNELSHFESVMQNNK